MRWCDTLFSTPAPAQDAWQRERMEYAFWVVARVANDAFGERTLSAAEYFEGRLDCTLSTSMARSPSVPPAIRRERAWCAP